jgi:hypothetical protein
LPSLQLIDALGKKNDVVLNVRETFHHLPV